MPGRERAVVWVGRHGDGKYDASIVTFVGVHNGLELGGHKNEVFNELGLDAEEGECMGARGVIAKPATPAQAASRTIRMNDIITERCGNILRIQLNRPAAKNAMTLAMYVTLAELFNTAAKENSIHVIFWHGAGDSFCAGNDVGDFLKNPPNPGEGPQALLIEALINFGKPIVAAVQGAAIGGGTTMLTHCDFVYAGESAKFQLPFVNLAVVPEFGASCTIPARIGYLRAAELLMLGQHFDALRAAELGLVTRVVRDQELLGTATATAQELAAKSPGALQACKRLMRSSTREQLKRAAKFENELFSARVRSPDAREAFTAILEKRPPKFAVAIQCRPVTHETKKACKP